MSKVRDTEKLRAPLMYAFRAAARAGDAKKVMDIREGGERVISGRRAGSARRRALNDAALRNLLIEDVTNLLNTTNLESQPDETGDTVRELDFVRKSILNYGLPDLAGRTIDVKMKSKVIREELLETLLRYEPRLIGKTIRIEDKSQRDDEAFKFMIHAEMRADPEPFSVEFVTEVEKQTGGISFKNA